MINALVNTPTSWNVVEPPPGVALVAIEPAAVDADGKRTFRPNVVVTMVDRPAGDDVDAYIEDVIAHLLVDLDGAELIDVFTIRQPIDLTADPADAASSAAGAGDAVPSAAGPNFGQRLIVQHRLGEITLETVQQHSWVDDTVVIVTVTVPVGRADELAPTLSNCLDSVAVAA